LETFVIIVFTFDIEQLLLSLIISVEKASFLVILTDSLAERMTFCPSGCPPVNNFIKTNWKIGHRRWMKSSKLAWNLMTLLTSARYLQANPIKTRCQIEM